jgi:maleate isomerase
MNRLPFERRNDTMQFPAIRLGIIIPSSNTTMEMEFNSLGKGKFIVHSTRVGLSRVTLAQLEKMELGAREAATLLADANVDIIAYGCTSGSLYRGLGHDVELANSITKKTGLPAVATAGCVVDGLKFLKARRVSVATPYVDEINDLEKKFLSNNGFEVQQIKGLGIEDNLSIGRIQQKRLIELAKEVDSERAQTIFISCTNLATLGIIPELERILRKPVVSSNSATLWSMLRKTNQDYHWIDWGTLFRT